MGHVTAGRTQAHDRLPTSRTKRELLGETAQTSAEAAQAETRALRRNLEHLNDHDLGEWVNLADFYLTRIVTHLRSSQ